MSTVLLVLGTALAVIVLQLVLLFIAWRKFISPYWREVASVWPEIRRTAARVAAIPERFQATMEVQLNEQRRT